MYIKCRNFVKFCLQKAALKVLREFKSKTEPPRDRSIYRTCASVAGGECGFDEGIYSAFEHDIGSMFMDMEGLIRGIREHSDNCVRTLLLGHVSCFGHGHHGLNHGKLYF